MSSASVSTARSKKRRQTSSPAGSLRSSTPTTTTAKSSWGREVPEILEKSGIYGPGADDNKIPKNLDAIKAKMLQRRDSLSSERFKDIQWSDFVRKNDGAGNESEVGTHCLPYFAYDSPGRLSSNVQFTQIDPLITNGDKMTALQPDHYTGLKPRDVPDEIYGSLTRYIRPSAG